MIVPDYKNRTAEQIITEYIYHDAVGFGLRAVSWIDLAERTGDFAALQYACIDARLAIEHLLFEQIVITKGAALFSDEDYERCLQKPTKLSKVVNSIVPDYEKRQAFTEIIGSLERNAPPVNQWNLKKLMRSWGNLSSFLHWKGAFHKTTEDTDWQRRAIKKVGEIVQPLWEKMSTAQSGSMDFDSMPPPVCEIWEEFRAGKIDRDGARFRLEYVRPHLKKYRAERSQH